MNNDRINELERQIDRIAFRQWMQIGMLMVLGVIGGLLLAVSRQTLDRLEELREPTSAERYHEQENAQHDEATGVSWQLCSTTRG